MKKLITVLVVIVVLAGVTWLIIWMNKKPKVELDANGFPVIRKEGDTFTKDGKVFTFSNGVWTTEEGGSGGNGGGSERKVCNGPDWTNMPSSAPAGTTPIYVEFKYPRACPNCILFRGSIYVLYSTSGTGNSKVCSYKKR